MKSHVLYAILALTIVFGVGVFLETDPEAASRNIGKNSELKSLRTDDRVISPSSRISLKRLRIDKVYNNKRYHNPTGEGVFVAVTDSWTVDDTHPELDGRVVQIHETTDLPEPDAHAWAHATSCAGIVAATGINPAVKGMAPDARIISMVSRFDPINEIAYAAEAYNVLVFSNSWGISPEFMEEILPHPPRILGATPAALDADYGYYPEFSGDLDDVIADTDILSIWAAGNGRSSNILTTRYDDWNRIWTPTAWHRNYPGYDTADPISGAAKNILAVGATHKDDAIAEFSVRGPAHEGRISPHLVAPGTNIALIMPDGGYGSGWGTSSSAPMVAGAAVLLQQQYTAIHGLAPGGALLKALMINTARDLGPVGPDYTYGFGIPDIELAALTIAGQEEVKETKKVTSRFVKGEIAHKEKLTYTFMVPKKRTDFRITLVWHDPAGAKLVNNLDVYARFARGKKQKPFTLDPNRPATPARNKRNKIDNTEHIVIESPEAGDWTITVAGKRITQGPQKFALVMSAHKGHNEPQQISTGNFTIDSVFASHGDINEPQTLFSAGDDLYMHALLDVPENAHYSDGFYGTVAINLELRNNSNQLIYFLTMSHENVAPTAAGDLHDLWYRFLDLPPDIPTGTYRVKTTVFMHNGTTHTAPEYQIEFQ